MARWRFVEWVLAAASSGWAFASAAAQVEFDGAPVPAISGISMGCKAPYALARDCSTFSGAMRQVPSLPPDFRVAGSADGRVVLIMSARMFGLQPGAEHEAALTVRDIAAATGAGLEKVEAVTAGPRVMGFVMSFDRAVYDALVEHPGLPARSRRAPVAMVAASAPGAHDPCELAEIASRDAPPTAGSAASSPQGSETTNLPRRYVMVVRDSGEFNYMRVATMVFGNAVVRVAKPNDVMDCLDRAVRSVLTPRRGFEPVGETMRMPVPSPRYFLRPDGAAGLGWPANARQQQDALVAELRQRAATLAADLVVILNEWDAYDAIEHTNQSVEGYGVYFRDVLALRDVYAYAAVQISILEPRRGRLSSWGLLGHTKLDRQRWIDLREGQVLADDITAGFEADVRAALPLRQVPAALCELQLLPALFWRQGFSLERDCTRSYPVP